MWGYNLNVWEQAVCVYLCREKSEKQPSSLEISRRHLLASFLT